ncbi:MAG: hypothetical protein AAGD04_05885 [Pseudomonadota bacterium]
MKKTACLCFTAALLAGCTETAEITAPPQQVSYISPDVKERFVRNKEVTLRTFIGKGSDREEVVGASCQVQSAELRGTIVTPSKIFVPVLKGKPTSLNVSCSKEELTGSRTVEASLEGTAVGGPSAAGLLAAVVSTAIVAGRDQWSYIPTIDVEVSSPEDAENTDS